MRERMHFSFELAVVKYLAAPVSESAVRYRPPRLKSEEARWLRWKSPASSGRCTAQRRQRWSTRRAMLSPLGRYDLLT